MEILSLFISPPRPRPPSPLSKNTLWMFVYASKMTIEIIWHTNFETKTTEITLERKWLDGNWIYLDTKKNETLRRLCVCSGIQIVFFVTCFQLIEILSELLPPATENPSYVKVNGLRAKMKQNERRERENAMWPLMKWIYWKAI